MYFANVSNIRCRSEWVKNPLQCVSSKSLCQNKPGKKVLLKLNRDHVTKVARKNRAELKKNKKGILINS